MSLCLILQSRLILKINIIILRILRTRQRRLRILQRTIPKRVMMIRVMRIRVIMIRVMINRSIITRRERVIKVISVTRKATMPLSLSKRILLALMTSQLQSSTLPASPLLDALRLYLSDAVILIIKAVTLTALS